MAVKHVPAWKKLGLQLKNGTGEDIRESESLKRKSLDDAGKSKAGGLAKRPKKTFSGDEVKSSEESGGDISNNGKKRKSVSFADAEELVQFSQTSAPSARTASNEEKDEHIFKDQQEQLTADVDDEERRARKLRKSELKQQRRKAPVSPLEPSKDSIKPRGYLDYLSRYSTDRKNWKFNKTFQSQLFRDIFDLYKVPASYSKAISEYIAGLQGTATRQRLRQTARIIVGEIMAGNDVSSAEAAKKAAETKQNERDAAEALARDQQLIKDALRQSEIEDELQSMEHRIRMEKLQRAAEMLRELADSEDAHGIDGPATASVKSTFDAAQSRQQPQRAKRSRGRKRRMTGIDDDESSSSSDSSSGSDNSSDSDTDSEDDTQDSDQSSEDSDDSEDSGDSSSTSIDDS